jgi:hypothetical protein
VSRVRPIDTRTHGHQQPPTHYHHSQRVTDVGEGYASPHLWLSYRIRHEWLRASPAPLAPHVEGYVAKFPRPSMNIKGKAIIVESIPQPTRTRRNEFSAALFSAQISRIESKGSKWVRDQLPTSVGSPMAHHRKFMSLNLPIYLRPPSTNVAPLPKLFSNTTVRTLLSWIH